MKRTFCGIAVLLFGIGAGACAPLAYRYSATERSSTPSPAATDAEFRVAYSVFDTQLNVLNAARRFCGLSQVRENMLDEVLTEMRVQVVRDDFVNRTMIVECP